MDNNSEEELEEQQQPSSSAVVVVADETASADAAASAASTPSSSLLPNQLADDGGDDDGGGGNAATSTEDNNQNSSVVAQTLQILGPVHVVPGRHEFQSHPGLPGSPAGDLEHLGTAPGNVAKQGRLQPGQPDQDVAVGLHEFVLLPELLPDHWGATVVVAGFFAAIHNVAVLFYHIH